MSAELAYVDGRAQFIGTEPGWHGEGTVRKDLTFELAMNLIHLNNWNVRTVPLAEIANYPVADPEAVAVVRTDPNTHEPQILAVRGRKYTPVQNEQAFAVASLLEDLGGKVLTAGAIRDGRQVFMMVDMNAGFVLDPDGAADAVNTLLALRTSHDGSLTVQAVPTLIRIVCANTFDAVSMEGAKAAYSIRHTESVTDSLAEAQALFAQAQGYMSNFATEAAALMDTTVRNNEHLKTIVGKFVARPEDKGRGQTGWDRRFTEIVGQYEKEANEAIHGTGWGGLNAVTEWMDWERTIKGELDKEGAVQDAEARSLAQMGMGTTSGWADKSGAMAAFKGVLLNA